MVVAFFAGLSSARATTVTNYLEKFENLNVADKAKFAPANWGRIADSLQPQAWGAEEIFVEYSNPTTGGQDNGAYLATGSQTLSYEDWLDPYASESKTAHDLIVSPAVTGDVSFYIKKKSAFSTPSIEIYTCTKSGDKFQKNLLIKEIASSQFSSDANTWTKVTLPGMPANSYLGFRLNNACIDEFTAASAEIVQKVSVEINKVIFTGTRDAITNAENKFTVSAEVILKNTGDVELNSTTPNYSVTLVNDSKTVDVVTVNVTETLAPGAVSAPIIVTADIDAGNEKMSDKYIIRENLGNTTKFLSWVDSKPYLPEMIFTNENDNADITGTINFGLLKDAAVTKNFKVNNNGMAPLKVTAFTLPEGYTSTLTAPFEVESQGEVIVPVTLGIEKVGENSGKISFTCDVIGVKEYSVTGFVLSPENWLEDFEAAELPKNMLFAANWSLSKEPSGLQTPSNTQWIENSNSSDPTKFITPKLTFKAGDKLNFKGGKRGSNTLLKVYYSADRKDWKLAKEFTSSDFSKNKAGTGYDCYEFTDLQIDNIPEGDWFVAFEAGYVRVDDIYGCVLTKLDHDIFFSSITLDKAATVNHELNIALNVKNMAEAEAAGTYNLKLYANDSIVCEANDTELLAYADNAINLAFTPHKDGVAKIYAELTIDSFTAVSDTIEVNIFKESSVEKSVIGQGEGNSSKAPLALNYKNSISETVYTADKLGLAKGAKIVKLSYDGYCTNDKDVTHHICVYAENTTATAPDMQAPSDVSKMTLVYEGDFKAQKIGSSSEMVEFLVLPLTEGFEYTGDNLRLVLTSTSSSYRSISFRKDVTSSEINTIYRYKDGDITTASWTETSEMPVVNIFTEKAVPTISGTVTAKSVEKSANNPVEGVKVKLTSGNVLYEALTDANGQYSIPVYQAEKEYDLAVVPGTNPEITELDYKHASKISFVTGDQVINIELTMTSGIEDVELNGFNAFGGNGTITVVADAQTTVNVYNANGMLVTSLDVEEGETVINDVLPGFYIVNKNKVLVR